MHRYQSKPIEVKAFRWGYSKQIELAQIIPPLMELFSTDHRGALVYKMNNIVGLIKKGEWFVSHSDNSYEVLDNKEFNTRYESNT